MEGISGREFSLCPSLKIRNIQNSHVPRKVSLVNLTNNSSRNYHQFRTECLVFNAFELFLNFIKSVKDRSLRGMSRMNETLKMKV